MLDLTAAFTLKNNPEFSCEPDLVETQSKAIFMVGKKTRIRKTGNLQPYSKLLPWPRWVADTTHLSHLSCVDGPMAMDARLKHGSFIGTARQLSLRRPHPGARHVWRHSLEQ